jgi:hypothetical protein
MKKVSQTVDDMLLDYIDGILNSHDAKKLEDALRTNQEWQTRLDELKVVTAALRQTALQHPSKNFTTLVMTKLDQYPATYRLSSRNGIFLLAGILVAVGITSLLVSFGIFDTTSNIDLNQVNVSKKFVNAPLPSFKLSGKLLVNTIIVLNLGLAWILLDRTILKPFFQKRIQRLH